jgi:predicted CopG family antitoxin
MWSTISSQKGLSPREAYNSLKNMKLKGESFSDMIKRLTERIENEPLFTITFNLFEAQIGFYSINEELRNKATDKLNKTFDRIEVLPFLKGDALKAAEIAGMLKRRGKVVG